MNLVVRSKTLVITSMIFESKQLQYEQINRGHAKELKGVLCDPRVYVNVDDGIAPTPSSCERMGLLEIVVTKRGLIILFG